MVPPESGGLLTGSGRIAAAALDYFCHLDRACFSPEGNHLMLASAASGSVIHLRLVGGQWQKHGYRMFCSDKDIKSIHFSPNGKDFAISDFKGVLINQLVDGEWYKRCILWHSSRLNGMSFSPSGNRLVTFSVNKTFTIWEVVNGQWQPQGTIRGC